MKITMYNKTGTIQRELDCIDIIPYGSPCLYEIILEKGRFSSNITKSILSNLPFVINDNKNMLQCRQPDETDPAYQITLLSDAGTTLNVWSNAKGLSYTNQYINFKINDTWHTIFGNVIIEGTNNES